ncbi:hypothetical protein H4R23_003277 [Coemansia sp. Cherry 401B]|nr:hypothetical protein H4R23_003277 [Coemansia sp. Cherry 401B]
MSLVDAQAAARVCKIAADLAAHEQHILYTSVLQRARPKLAKGGSFGSALATLWQAPTQALANSLFGRGAVPTDNHVHPIESALVNSQETRNAYMVWLAWDDCRSLDQVFRHLEYVGADGKPTQLVDSFVSRLTGGESVAEQANNVDDVRGAAWLLISRIFARATALRVSAEAEEVEDALAVLTWFPRLEYLETQRIPRTALRFWATWLPGRLSSLRMDYAGIDLRSVLDVGEWERLALLDLSGNAGIDLEPLRSPLTQRLPQVARLSLARCELDGVPAMLSSLYSLAWLDLSDNAIDDVADISLRIGGVVRLNLANNQLTDIGGLRRLWALEVLDVSGNQLGEWQQLLALRNLPALRELRVEENPFADSEYRAQVFSAFDHRDVGLALDGRAPTAAERRAMARIPRVATEHRGGVPAAEAGKLRRPKVALIEESADADEAADRGSDCGPGIDDAAGEQRPISALEKTPRILRASELQAVAVAAAHRRSNVANYGLAGPAAISMKARARGQRRATAGTVGGGLGAGVRYGPRAAHACSVPSSFTTRPCSPAPSSAAGSVRAPSIRDPERFRRRVEMMRAEAGSSWLRAFAELQQQQQHVSPLQSPELARREVAELPAIGEAPSSEAEDSPAPEPADTKLPSFLFPRRKAAQRRREVKRLPHYSPGGEHVEQAAAEQPRPESVASAGLAAIEEAEPVEDGALGEEGAAAEPELDELQRLEGGEGVVARAADVEVARFRLAAGDGARTVRRAECGRRTVYVTGAEIVEAADGGVAARTALAAVVRVRLSDGGVVVEAKAGRFEAAEWIAYGAAALEPALQAAAAANAGLEGSVYRQAECLRCGWRGFVDAERAAWDVLADGAQVAGRGQECPACGRAYMRDYYADDAGAAGPGGDAGAPGIRALVGRARRGRPAAPAARARGGVEADAQTQQQVAEARAGVAAARAALGGSTAAAPFAEATNAVRLHLQLSVFAEGERLLQWAPAGLVWQAAPLGSSSSSSSNNNSSSDEPAELAAYVALSTHALYVFALAGGGEGAELAPAQHLRAELALPLTRVGRIDVGPNRQYLAVHAGLLARARGAWDAAGLAAGASCVLLVRDRLACSDVVDALAEIGYETRALDAGGAGSGRQRALNHDVEWAMHHLVQQPLRRLRDELQGSLSGRGPGALVDAASGDSVIVDRVTYEFLKLYVCAGVAGGGQVRARTVVATAQFVYVVRERVDVWPPPVPDLRELYRRWQRAAAPTIVTSDPDTYDPQAVARALARRAGPLAGAEPLADPEPVADAELPADAEPLDPALLAQLAAAAVPQYDCVEHARPVRDVRRVTLVAGGVGGWRAALRVDFAQAGGGLRAWTLWFATPASARECSDALVALARAAGAAVVDADAL